MVQELPACPLVLEHQIFPLSATAYVFVLSCQRSALSGAILKRGYTRTHTRPSQQRVTGCLQIFCRRRSVLVSFEFPVAVSTHRHGRFSRHCCDDRKGMDLASRKPWPPAPG